MRKPKRTVRSSMPSRPVSRIPLASTKFPLLTPPLGTLKCGVLVKLKISARNWTLTRSLTWNLRKIPRSVLNRAGPVMLALPQVPKRRSVLGTRANAEMS
jgi:hypothetical protein